MKKFHIFDLDGTLADSMYYWRLVCSDVNIISDPASWEGIFDEMREYYKNDVNLKEGAAEYLSELKASGASLCIATGTRRDVCEPLLKKTGLMDCMDFFVDCYEAGEFKESPKIYLDCIKRFGAEISDCTVYEDSPTAAKTAKTAGFYVVGVYDKITVNDGDITPFIDEYVKDWKKIKIAEA